MENNFTRDYRWMHDTYDRYAAMLFPVLLNICKTQQDAEELLVLTFEAVYKEYNSLQNKPVNLILLVKLAVDIAKKPPFNCRIPEAKQFKQSSMLHSFIFDNVNMQGACEQTGLSRMEIAQQVRQELLLHRTQSRLN